jgi:hypothetical protein
MAGKRTFCERSSRNPWFHIDLSGELEGFGKD